MLLPSGTRWCASCSETCSSSHNGLDRLCLTASRSATLRFCTSRSMRVIQAMRRTACKATWLWLFLMSSSNFRLVSFIA